MNVTEIILFPTYSVQPLTQDGSGMYVFGSPVITIASCLVDAVWAVRNHTISEYLRGMRDSIGPHRDSPPSMGYKRSPSFSLPTVVQLDEVPFPLGIRKTATGQAPLMTVA